MSCGGRCHRRIGNARYVDGDFRRALRGLRDIARYLVGRRGLLFDSCCDVSRYLIDAADGLRDCRNGFRRAARCRLDGVDLSADFVPRPRALLHRSSSGPVHENSAHSRQDDRAWKVLW